MRSLEETIANLADELSEVEDALAQPDVASDVKRLRDLSRRHKELAEIVGVERPAVGAFRLGNCQGDADRIIG